MFAQIRLQGRFSKSFACYQMRSIIWYFFFRMSILWYFCRFQYHMIPFSDYTSITRYFSTFYRALIHVRCMHGSRSMEHRWKVCISEEHGISIMPYACTDSYSFVKHTPTKWYAPIYSFWKHIYRYKLVILYAHILLIYRRKFLYNKVHIYTKVSTHA